MWAQGEPSVSISKWMDWAIVRNVLHLLWLCIVRMLEWESAPYQRAPFYDMTAAMADDPCAHPCTIRVILYLSYSYGRSKL